MRSATNNIFHTTAVALATFLNRFAASVRSRYAATLRSLPGVRLKQFTARDVISRWDVLNIYSRATTATVSSFLQHLSAQLPGARQSR